MARNRSSRKAYRKGFKKGRKSAMSRFRPMRQRLGNRM